MITAALERLARVTGGGRTIKVDSAQPQYRANGLPAGGLEVEAVYAGLGSGADFAGKDVRGKAVFVHNMLGIRPENAVRRADEKGAAVIFEVDMLPGNMRYQARDGWFDAAGDNASGVATLVALVEYYAKIPARQWRRTLVFVGLDGHHNSGEGAGVGRRWMWDNRATLFTKTALMINAEHPSTILAGVRQRYQGGDNIVTSEVDHYFHTDRETPETVLWTGLEASARAYAKIIDGVNTLELTDLQRPEEPAPVPAAAPSRPPAPSAAR